MADAHRPPVLPAAGGTPLLDPQSSATAECAPEPLEIREFLTGTDGRGMPPLPNVLRHPLRAAGWLIVCVWGMAAMVLVLAVVAAIPVGNFLALGYLLEAEGRVARSGRLRDGFPLLEMAPRIGSIVAGMWLFLFPVALLAGAAADAQIIEPGGPAATNLHRLTIVVAILAAIHLCLALARGGSLGCFFRPVKNVRWLRARLRAGDYWDTAERSVERFVAPLRLKHHFSLGVRGFAAAFAWLVLPTALFAAADRTQSGAFPVTLLGSLLLVPVLCWTPFLQARFAAENRFRTMFQLKPVRRLFRQAPLAWFTAVATVYVLALPLYLLKIALPPADAMWLITLIFIVSIYPAKLATGWAYARALRRDRPAWFGWRWLSRLLSVALVAVYVFLLFFTQFLGEHGKGVLFEHHALLLPTPF